MPAVRTHLPSILSVFTVLAAGLCAPALAGQSATNTGPPGTHASLTAAHRATPSAARASAARYAAKLPLTFTRNDGQDADPAVRYIGQGAGVSVLFTERGVTLDLSQPTPRPAGAGPGPAKPPSAHGVSVSLDFLHASGTPSITGAGRQTGRVNYFQGNDAARWHTGIPAFADVVYHDVWPGIDADFTARGGVLRYSFTLAAGANPAEIRLGYAGARRLALTGSGALSIRTGAATLTDQAPDGTQPVAGQVSRVAVRYRLLGGTTFGFAAGRRARAPLTIDPGLDYSTFLGGSDGLSVADAVQSDAAGDVYVFGETGAANFPTTPGAYQRTINTSYDDFFVTKLNPAGNGLVYSTFVGGNGKQDLANGVVNSSGDVYFTGASFATNFPATPGAFHRAPFPGPEQSILFELNPTGSALVYSTYLAPGLDSAGYADNMIGLAPGGSVIVSGTTYLDYAPTTPGAFQDTYPGGTYTGYAIRMNATGSRPIYATYLGAPLTTPTRVGCDPDTMTVDAKGDAYIVAECGSNFPTTKGAYQRTAAKGGMILAKLNPSGTKLDYATYWSKDLDNYTNAPAGVAVNSAGDAYVVGNVLAGSVPVTAGAYARHCAYPGGKPPVGTYCIGIAEFNPTGTKLLYGSYFGGDNASNNSDAAFELALGSSGTLYLVGTSGAEDIPTTPGAYSTKPGPYEEPYFLAVFKQAHLTYASYFGGTASACIGGVCGFVVGGIGISPGPTPGAVYLGGTTGARNFPVTPGAFQTTYPGGGNEPWIAKLTLPSSG
jgi:hypothetical protein